MSLKDLLHKHLIISFPIILILFSILPFVGEAQWSKLNGPYGCFVADVTIDPTDANIAYVAIDGSGVFKSVDGGQTWSEKNSGLTDNHAWVIEIDPFNAQIIYIGTWNMGIFKSTDGGSTWGDLTSGLGLSKKVTCYDIAINPTDPNVIYIGTSDGLFKTMDRGSSWTRKDYDPLWYRIYSLAIDPTDTDILFAGTWGASSNQIYKSTDGGDTWSTTAIGLDEKASINAIVVNPVKTNTLYAGTDSGVYKSIDGGGTWSLSSSGIHNLFIRDLAIDPTNPNRLITATWGGAFETADEGNNWSQIQQWDQIQDGITTNFVKSVTIAPSKSEEVYIGAWGGVQVSSDASVSWSAMQNSGLPQDVNTAPNGLLISPDDPQIIYIATLGGGIAKTIDGGASWAYINAGLSMGFDQPASCHSTQPNIIYVGTDGGGIFKSTDAGATWKEANTGLTNFLIIDFAFHPDDPNVIYVGTDDGLLKSTDGGDHWFTIDQGITDLHIKDIEVDHDDPDIVYIATRSAGVFKSTDGGSSWTSSNTGIDDMRIRVMKMNPQDPLTLYVGGYGGLYKTTNGGETWTAYSNGIPSGSLVRVLAVHPTRPQILFAGVALGGIYKSTDGGMTWLPWNNGINPDVRSIGFDPESPNVVYSGTGAGVYKWLPYLAPQIINPGNKKGVKGRNVSLQIKASDPEEDILSYSATGLPPGLAINTSTGLIKGRLSNDSAGKHDVTVSVTDGVNSTSATFTWQVSSPQPPSTAPIYSYYNLPRMGFYQPQTFLPYTSFTYAPIISPGMPSWGIPSIMGPSGRITQPYSLPFTFNLDSFTSPFSTYTSSLWGLGVGKPYTFMPFTSYQMPLSGGLMPWSSYLQNGWFSL